MKFKKGDLVKLYVNLVRTAAYDQWLLRKSLTGEMKATYHPVWGDYVGVGGCTFLMPDDVIYAHGRGHGTPHLIGKGPSFIECKTVRTGPHATVFADTAHGKPRAPKMVEEMMKRDAVVLLRVRLLEQGILTTEDVERIDKEVAEEVADTERFVNESPILDDPSVLDQALYAD